MPNWNEVLSEIKSNLLVGQQAVDLVRRDYLQQLHKYTNRNVIAYYSGFLSKPNNFSMSITDEDKNGFMMAVHKLDRSLGLDLILHTPGGDIAATQSIVNYLHSMFGHNIRAIIPQIAMSAGTMIACSCKEILMAKHSNLGPIDPHLNGYPAYGVIQEFEKACEEIKLDASKIPIWSAIIQQYKPAFLSQCRNAIDWSNQFVEENLTNVMFEGQKTGKTKAKNIVKKLTDFTGNKTHSRHIHHDELKKMGLKVSLIEDEKVKKNEKPYLQDLVVTVHHCYMHSIQNTTSFKLIENHLGVALVKNINSKN